MSFFELEKCLIKLIFLLLLKQKFQPFKPYEMGSSNKHKNSLFFSPLIIKI